VWPNVASEASWRQTRRGPTRRQERDRSLRTKHCQTWHRPSVRKMTSMDEGVENATIVPQLTFFTPMNPDPYTPHTTPIIIDNGCTSYRFGFSSFEEPYIIPNIYSRYRERRHNMQIALFGDNVEIESGAKTQSKTAWEGDILINFDAMENALDYAFCKLGLNTSTVQHPVVISERLCTPIYSRSGELRLSSEQNQSFRGLWATSSN